MAVWMSSFVTLCENGQVLQTVCKVLRRGENLNFMNTTGDDIMSP